MLKVYINDVPFELSPICSCINFRFLKSFGNILKSTDVRCFVPLTKEKKMSTQIKDKFFKSEWFECLPSEWATPLRQWIGGLTPPLGNVPRSRYNKFDVLPESNWIDKTPKFIKSVVDKKVEGMENVPLDIFIQCLQTMNPRYYHLDNDEIFLHISNLATFEPVRFMWPIRETKFTKSDNWYSIDRAAGFNFKFLLSSNRNSLESIEQFVSIDKTCIQFMTSRLRKYFVPLLLLGNSTSFNIGTTIEFFINRLKFSHRKYYFDLYDLTPHYSREMLSHTRNDTHEDDSDDDTEYQQLKDVYVINVRDTGGFSYSRLDFPPTLVDAVDTLYEICEYLSSELAELDKIFGKHILDYNLQHGRDGVIKISELGKFSTMESSWMNLYCKNFMELRSTLAKDLTQLPTVITDLIWIYSRDRLSDEENSCLTKRLEPVYVSKEYLNNE